MSPKTNVFKKWYRVIFDNSILKDINLWPDYKNDII